MRAIVIHKPHDLRVDEFPPLPLVLKDNAVRVSLAAGGICGSDLHYYHHGGFGVVRVKHPMVLGHEAAGFVESVGQSVTGFKKGDLVAINPSSPCYDCPQCTKNNLRHCDNMFFNGSAMRNPHVDGLFREAIDIDASRAFLMPSSLKPELAALCEPLAVVLHAFNQAGDVQDKNIFVSGAGPIGALAIIIAKLKGAKSILASDITPYCLTLAKQIGATEVVNTVENPESLAKYQAGKGTIDVVFECSGNAQAIHAAVMTIKPQGILVFVGLGGDAPLPINAIVGREITLRGTFRFDKEFGEAASLISANPHEFAPLISATYKMNEAVKAFEHAGDRTRATKVAIIF